MAWYDRILGIEREEKLNPAQPYIALDEGLTIDTRQKKDNYRSAYEELEVVNRAVNMIVDDTSDIPLTVGQKVNGIAPVVANIRKNRVDLLLNKEPNPFQDINTFKRNLIIDLLIDGKLFPRNERDTKYELTPKYFKRHNKGNNASNPFHIETRWKVDWTRMPSGWKTWQTVKGIKTIVRAYYTLDKVLLKVDLQSIRMATTLRKYVASQFKPSIAKAFYDYFGSVNVLDFSAGWGDRLAGFYCGETTKSFVRIDPNSTNHPNYKRQVEFYKKHQTFFEEQKQEELNCSPAEDVDNKKYEINDIILLPFSIYSRRKIETSLHTFLKEIIYFHRFYLSLGLKKMLTLRSLTSA